MEENVWISDSSQSTRLFAGMVESFFEIALAADHHGTVIYGNPAARAALDYVQQPIPQATLDRFFRLDEQQRTRLASCLEQGDCQRFETRAVARDGRTFPVRLTLWPLRAAEGIRGVVAVAVDLTEHERAREASQDRDEAQRLLRERLENLYTVNIELAQAANVDELCRLAVELARSRLGIDRMGIWFAHPSEPYTFTGSFGTDEQGRLRDERRCVVVVKEDDPLVQVMARQSPLILQNDESLVNDRYSAVGTGMRATAPLWDGKKVIGILATDNLLRHEPITAEQAEIIKLFASGLAHLYSRKLAEQDVLASEQAERAFREKLQALYEVNIELAMCTTTTELCRRTIELARSRLGFDRISIWLTDSSSVDYLTGSFGTDEHGNIRDERNSRYRIPEDGLTRQVLSRKMPVGVVDNFPLYDDRQRPVGQGTLAEASLWDGSNVLGLLLTDNLITRRAITREQAEILKLLASGLGPLYTRKRAEEALRQSELGYRRLVESTQDWVWAIDPIGRLTFSNEAVERLLGFGADELVGNLVFGFVQSESRAHVHRLLTLAVERRKGWRNVLTRWIHKDGSVRFLESTSQAIFDPDGKLIGFAGIDRDITDRRLAEQALREERDFANDLIETTPVLVLVIDTQGRIVRYNHAVTELTGHRLEEMQGKSWFKEFLPQHDRDRMSETFKQVLSGVSCRGIVNSIVTKDGHERDIEWYNKTLKDSNGQITGVLGIGLDITERRTVEEQLRQAQKMEAVGQLAGGIAHDFNNQLTVVKGYSELLMRKLPPSDPSLDAVEEIHKAAARAAALTGQLLAFSRKQILNPEVFNINTILRELADPLTRIIGEQIHLSLAVDPKLGNTKADASHFRQTVMNLVLNARDAMPEGGRLVLETRNVNLNDVYVASHVDAHGGPHVLLAVTDDGVGISPAVLQRVFEPFFTTKAVDKGTGLGLAMVYGFVKQSGGHVTVTSTPGKGTTFEIYLPRVDMDVAPLTTRPSATAHYRGSETILLAEDDESVRKMVAKLLRQQGYTVLETGNAHEALPLGEHYDGPIHMLISDVVMPGMSGPELAKRLRKRRPGLPVLFLTGYADRATMQSGVRGPLDQLLTKPFQPDQLGMAVRSLLNAAGK